ncbi:hypothetical protein Droror1_Dr00013316 [Drosera rotundifolia]
MQLNPKALELKKLLANGAIISLSHLKQAHARLIRLHLNTNNYLLNSLLVSSFTFNPSFANRIFSQLERPNLFHYNTMIKHQVGTGRLNDAINNYVSLRVTGLLPDNYTFPFVLKAAARIGNGITVGIGVHGCVVKMGFDGDVFVGTGLVCLYAKLGRLGDARKVFDEMPEKNVVAWCGMISGYVEAGMMGEGVRLFGGMVKEGLRVDSLVVVRVLLGCVKAGDLESGEWVLSYAEECGVAGNLFVRTALIDLYSKCGRVEKARGVFDEMVEKDIVCWSAMIQGYASNGFPKEALDVFDKMVEQEIKPDCYAMVGVLQACASIGALDFGEQASKLMERSEFLANAILGTSLIDLYAKCGDMSSAWKIFREMKERDRVIFNTAICGLAMNAHVDVTFGVFGQMEKLGIRPDGNTFIGLLCACTHAGLVRDGRTYFQRMQNVYSVSSTVEHYGCMVDLLGRAGLLQEAHGLIRSMPMAPNAIVWGALLGGCRLHRDTELAELVLKELIVLEPWNAGHYILLSNIYSANKKWKDAAKLRLKMDEQDIQKPPACSWMEVDGVVHEFLVGDKFHPMSDWIYAKLDELMRDIGAPYYVPTTDLVLFNA